MIVSEMSEWREADGGWEWRLEDGRTLFVWQGLAPLWCGVIETRTTEWRSPDSWATRRAAQAAIERAAGVGRKP